MKIGEVCFSGHFTGNIRNRRASPLRQYTGVHPAEYFL